MLRDKIKQLDEDRTTLRKLIAMQMDNQGGLSKEDLNEMMGDFSTKTEGKKKPRLVMKKFQNVLLKSYKNENQKNDAIKTQKTVIGQ